MSTRLQGRNEKEPVFPLVGGRLGAFAGELRFLLPSLRCASSSWLQIKFGLLVPGEADMLVAPRSGGNCKGVESETR